MKKKPTNEEKVETRNKEIEKEKRKRSRKREQSLEKFREITTKKEEVYVQLNTNDYFGVLFKILKSHKLISQRNSTHKYLSCLSIKKKIFLTFYLFSFMY